MNTISSYTHSAMVESATLQPITVTADNNALLQAKANTANDSGIQISISAESRERLAKEKNELGQKLAEQFQENKPETTSDETTVTDAERLDKMIKEVQQQIKELQRQISALNNNKSEKAQEQREALEAQLVSLNATLLGLMGKKMETLKQASE